MLVLLFLKFIVHLFRVFGKNILNFEFISLGGHFLRIAWFESLFG